MRMPTEAEIIARGIEQVLSYIPHYSQEENIRLLNNRLMTIVYRDSPDVIFATYIALYNVARKYEKSGNLERALDHYYWILYLFYPIGSSYFERPAIICEKLKRYDEAILVTRMYVKVAASPKAHMDLPAAQHRLNRLLSKRARQK